MTSIQEQIAISETLGGIKAYYGMRLRPFSLGAQPKGQSAVFTKEQAPELFPHLVDANNVRHGVIGYPKPLSAEDAERFDLIELNIDKGIEQAQANAIPSDELADMLADALAEHFVANFTSFTLEEITYDPEFELREAFKQTTLFATRKDNPDDFQAYRECLASLPFETVIAKIKVKRERVIG